MTEYYVSTYGNCVSLVDKLNAALGYPNKNTLTYARIKKHGKQDQYMVVIKEVFGPRTKSIWDAASVANELTVLEKLDLKTEAILSAEGAFDHKENT